MTKVDIRDYFKANNIDEIFVNFNGEEYLVVCSLLYRCKVDGKEYISVEAIKNTDIFLDNDYDVYDLLYPMRENDEWRFQNIPFNCGIENFDCSNPIMAILDTSCSMEVRTASKPIDDYGINNAYVVKSFDSTGAEIFWTVYFDVALNHYY